jgi:hypothetical protein
MAAVYPDIFVIALIPTSICINVIESDQEITGAQRLVAEWKPNPAECETETVGKTD